MSDSKTVPYWTVFVARALVALAIAVAITFSADHSAQFGLLTFGLFALLSGAVTVAGALLALPKGIERTLFVAQGIFSVLVGALALATQSAGLAFFLFLVSAWGALTGFLEIYLGLRKRSHNSHGKDWVFAGAITAILAIVALLVPGDFSQAYSGPDNVERFLTASVIVVGSLGAYCAILGVYLVIAGLSLKWAKQETAVTSAAGSSK